MTDANSIIAEQALKVGSNWTECHAIKPPEISDHNLKMWEEIYAEEKRREGSDKDDI